MIASSRLSRSVVSLSGLLMVLAALLSACQPKDYDTSLPEISKESPLSVEVSGIRVQRLGDLRNISKSPLPRPASQLATDWLEQRLHAVGDAGKRLDIDITEARTTRTPDGDSDDYLAYRTRVRLALRLYQPGARLADTSSFMEFAFSRELEKDASMEAREAFFAGISRELIARLEAKFPAHLEQYYDELVVNPAPQP